MPKKRLLSTLIAGLQATIPLLAQTEKQPNIIYIFPDQHRNHAMGFWQEEGFREKINVASDPVQTPNIDRFAKESLVLTSAQSNFPLSSPHRGMLLTGMYPDGSGVPLNCNSNRPLSGLKKEAITISDVLNKNGYQCAYIGKYHLDFPTKNNPQQPGHYVEEKRPAWDSYTPTEHRHGFTYWYSYGTFDVHKSPHYWDSNGNRHEIKEWSPQHEADKIIEFLDNQYNPEKPLFLMWSINPPHSPYNSLDDCMEQDYNLYKEKPLAELLIRPNVNQDLKEKQQCAPFYFASVTGVDREFGRVLEALTRHGLDKNSIIVFSSDHGETMASHIKDAKNAPYAEAMNVPFIIRYPEKIVPGVSDLLLSTPDVMPTLLSLAHLEKEIPPTVQGTDLSIFMQEGETAKEAPQGALYIKNQDDEKDADGITQSYFPVARGIKTKTHTLSITINREQEITEVLLFDDLNDPYQMNKINPNEQQELFKSLCRQMGPLLRAADDPWFRNNILKELIAY